MAPLDAVRRADSAADGPTRVLGVADDDVRLARDLGRRVAIALNVQLRGRAAASTASGSVPAASDLEALEETIAVLSDADAVQQLAASDTELSRGETETEDQLAEAMRRRKAGA